MTSSEAGKGKMGPLKGIKGVCFAWVGVGPLQMKFLADHGATVIRVESHARPCLIRMMSPFKGAVPGVDNSYWFPQLNSSFLSVSIDMSKPKGRELAWKLTMWADVVAESFVPGTMKKWGLDYETVSKVRPDLVYLSTCQMGQTGPFSTYAGHGYHATAISGISGLSGWPDRRPSPPIGAYTDHCAFRMGAPCLLAALDYRRRTGKGQHLDQSQLESSIHFIAPVAMDYAINDRVQTRFGNRNPRAVPHGVYPCIGDDRWCAISVFAEEEWQGLCKAMGKPAWTQESRFATFLGRKQNEDELDALVGAWTVNLPAEQVETTLQQLGVPASVVETNQDLFEDPQMTHRGFFRRLKHSVLGIHAYQGMAFKLSKTPDCQAAAPALGEHNEHVFKEILKLSDDEIADLLAERVITTEADLPEFRPSFV